MEYVDANVCVCCVYRRKESELARRTQDARSMREELEADRRQAE
jgi:hypothetical protein